MSIKYNDSDCLCCALSPEFYCNRGCLTRKVVLISIAIMDNAVWVGNQATEEADA